MASNSVWFEEVDKALVKLVRKVIDPKMQVFFTVDRDLLPKGTKINYPYTKVHHLDSQFDFSRYEPLKQVVSSNSETHEVTLEDSALPYILNYQVEFISNTNSMNNITTRKWFGSIKPFFTLKVVDSGGVSRNSFVSCLPPVTLEEKTEDDKIIFRCIIRMKVRVELDESTPQTFKTPTKGLELV